MKMPNKITYICKVCGSENVVWDAYAKWNIHTQEMELHNTFDESICDDCGETNCAVEMKIPL